jgi:transposase-like protein
MEKRKLPYHKYSKEFREEAVKLVTEGGQSHYFLTAGGCPKGRITEITRLASIHILHNISLLNKKLF